MTKALITGISGQDGSYPEKLLLEEVCKVSGLVPRAAPKDRERRLWHISGIQDIALYVGTLPFPLIV